MDLSGIISLAIAGIGVSGLIFTALRWRRDDTTAIVSQQDTIFGELRALNAELRATTERLRAENATLIEQVDRLTAQVQELKHDHY